MSNNVIIMIVLAAAAAFLLLKLMSVLGTRSGFEDPHNYGRRRDDNPQPGSPDDNVVPLPTRNAETEEDDGDIFAVAELESQLGKILKSMKQVDSSFNVHTFIEGSKGAYEMLLTAFEAGDRETLQPFLSRDVFVAFSEAIDQREKRGHTVEMRFVGIRTAELTEASFAENTRIGEITMRFVAEVITATRDESGEIVEGDPQAIQKVTDIWTFSRKMGSEDPNWVLVATGG